MKKYAMKKLMTPCLALALIFALALPPVFSLSEAGGKAYVETVLDFPGEIARIRAIQQTRDRAVVFLADMAEGGVKLLRFADLAGPPEEIPVPPLAPYDILDFSIAPDGNYLLHVAERAGQKADTFSYCWLDGAAEPEVFTIEEPANRLVALSDRRLIGYGRQIGATLYEADGAVRARFAVAGAGGLAISESALFAFVQGGVEEWSLATGEKVATHPGVDGSLVYTPHATPEGDIYLLSRDGVYALDITSGGLTQRLAGMGVMLGMADMDAKDLFVFEDGSFLLLLESTGPRAAGEPPTQALVRYTEGAAIGERTPFYIDAMRDHECVRAAASEFQRRHPELAVTYRVAFDSASDVPFVDRSRTMLTRLMADTDLDVILLDGLPREEMAERGMLMDLTGLAAELDLLPGIAKASAGPDGKTFAVPLAFQCRIIVGKRSALEGVRTIRDLVNAPVEPRQRLMAARAYDELLQSCYTASFPDFMAEDGTIDFTSEAFQTFLQDVYALYARQDEMPEVRYNYIDVETAGVLDGTIAAVPTGAYSVRALGHVYSQFGGEDVIAIPYPSLWGERGGTYTPDGIAAIYANTKRQALCEAFIRLMCSLEIQGTVYPNGLPTTSAGLAAVFDSAMEAEDAYFAGMVRSAQSDIAYETWKPDEAFIRMIERVCAGVDTAWTRDATLIGFVVEETEPFFEGTSTAREAGEALQQRTLLYFNE